MMPGSLFGIVISLSTVPSTTSYISNTATFPEPLSEEEEYHLLKKMESGNENARNILIERNLRLVAHVVKKFGGYKFDNQDLISIGTIGLIKAINTFDSNKKTRLGTYAARCIENEILMHLRTSKKKRNEVFLHDPIGSDDEGNEISLIDILGTEGDIVSERVETDIECEKLHETLKCLTKREKRVVELRYGLMDGIKKTQREISKHLGISRSYVSRIEKRAISKLHKAMFVDGYR